MWLLKYYIVDLLFITNQRLNYLLVTFHVTFNRVMSEHRRLPLITQEIFFIESSLISPFFVSLYSSHALNKKNPGEKLSSEISVIFIRSGKWSSQLFACHFPKPTNVIVCIQIFPICTLIWTFLMPKYTMLHSYQLLISFTSVTNKSGFIERRPPYLPVAAQ